MTKTLSAAEVESACSGLPGWSFAGGALEKTYRFSNFREALSFMVRVGFEAEALDHHPEWTNVYNRVAIRLSTHDAGNTVTAKDVALAHRIEAVLAAKSP